MAYASAFNATRYGTFSNPNLRYGGHPCGVPVGQSDEAYGALAIHNVRDEVAAFRPTMIGSSSGGSSSGGTNLALGKAVTVSSIESGSLDGPNAVDGDGGTRWASESGDPQWIYVDLGQTYNINRVVLNWEAAYASAYSIQIWNSSAGAWESIYSTSSGNGGVDDIGGLNASARWALMYGTQRATSWGYSLWEFEVYGSTGGSSSGGSSSGGSSSGGGGGGASSDGSSGGSSSGSPIEVFQHCDYAGWSIGIGEGSHNIAAIEAAGGVNNDASSLKIPAGYQVTLYNNDDFSGTSVVLTGDTACLVGFNFNDMLSSMVVSTDDSNSGGSSSGSGSGGLSTGGGGCSSIPQYLDSNNYNTGDVVQNDGNKYSCTVGVLLVALMRRV